MQFETEFNVSQLAESAIHNQFLCGDSTEIAKQLPTACVDTVVTSPPYYQQRDYGSTLQIGQELSPAAYVERMAELFTELKRVVKPTGSAWVVIGDKYVDGELLGMPWRVCLALKKSAGCFEVTASGTNPTRCHRA